MIQFFTETDSLDEYYSFTRVTQKRWSQSPQNVPGNILEYKTDLQKALCEITAAINR